MILTVLIALLVLSFCLSAIDAALLAVSRVRCRHYANAPDSRSRERSLGRLVSHRERTLTANMILNHLCNLAAFGLITRLLVVELGDKGYLASFLIALPIYLVFLEVVPKAIARRIPYRLLLSLVPLAIVADFLFGHLIHLGGRFGEWLEQVDEETTTSDERLREEFKSLTSDITKRGGLGEIENRMIHRIIEAQDFSASDVLVPLSDVTAVPLAMPVSTLLDLARQNDYEHFPVLGPTGALVGTVNVFDILLSGDTTGTVFQHLHKLPSVGPEVGASEILYLLRRSGLEIAAVLDDEGNPLGITSADDLAGLLLGEQTGNDVQSLG